MAAVDGRNIHQVQDDRAQTDSFGPYLSAFRFNLPCRLAYAPQDVECKRRNREDERIGLVVCAWKSLDIHVRLEFAVKLFARGMVMVELDDSVGIFRQVCPPCRRGVARKQFVIALHALHLPDAEQRPVRG